MMMMVASCLTRLHLRRTGSKTVVRFQAIDRKTKPPEQDRFVIQRATPAQEHSRFASSFLNQNQGSWFNFKADQIHAGPNTKVARYTTRHCGLSLFTQSSSLRMSGNQQQHRCFFTFTSNVEEVKAAAERARKSKLIEIYAEALKYLPLEKKRDLVWSGDLWWNYSNLSNRPIILSDNTLLQVAALQDSAHALRHHEPSIEHSLSAWEAFRLSMTHHSTAIEGNTLTMEQVATCLHHFRPAIATGKGITSRAMLDNLDPTIFQDWGHKQKDIIEVVNHATALEYARYQMFNSEVTAQGICELYLKLMPPELEDENAWSVLKEELRADHGPYRRTPISVTGSSSVRPYPHEVPALMERIVDLYHHHLLCDVDPVVATILFTMNFLFVHPFPDGNGRMSRLLLQTLLCRHGMLGCIVSKEERSVYMSHMTPYQQKNDMDGIVGYIVGRISVYHSELAVYEETKRIPDFTL